MTIQSVIMPLPAALRPQGVHLNAFRHTHAPTAAKQKEKNEGEKSRFKKSFQNGIPPPLFHHIGSGNRATLPWQQVPLPVESPRQSHLAHG